MLDAMEPDERVMFLGAYPRLAVGERAANACRDRRRGTARILMTHVPDDYLREVLESSPDTGDQIRVEDYRQALREAGMRLERLFAGPGSQVLAEIRGQVEAEIAKEERFR